MLSKCPASQAASMLQAGRLFDKVTFHSFKLFSIVSDEEPSRLNVVVMVLLGLELESRMKRL